MGLLEKLSTMLRQPKQEAPAELPGRNDDCWCGSGKKYKKCHLPVDQKRSEKSSCAQCGPT